VAYAWASNCPRADRRRAEIGYLRAAAGLMARGVDEFQWELRAAGLDDSLRAGRRKPAGAFLVDGPESPAYAQVFQHPLSAAAHAACAESLLARRDITDAVVEYRLSLALAPGRIEDRLRLAELDSLVRRREL
jgi:hypothetical protein